VIARSISRAVLINLERIFMKTQTLFASFTLTLAMASSAFAAGEKHEGAHAHNPRHGGVVTATKQMDFELVAKSTAIQLYLSDHGKAFDVSKAGAKLTLLTGTDKQEVELKPAGDKLEATGSFKVGPGTKAVAVVTAPGRSMTARFSIK
jgi:hypothetical protein